MSSKRFSGPHIGFAGFFIVITFGLVLMLLNVGVSLAITLRIPATNVNLTAAGCLGEKGKAIDSLPAYVQGKLGDNHDFINHSMTMTVGPIEGCEIGILGHQAGAPGFNFHFKIKN
jgi:hypothetical protein